MHPTNPATPGYRNERLLRQVNTLQTLLRRGWFIEFYDPKGTRYGLPTYPYRFAPDGLLTIRRLRARGLRPGGQDVAAQIVWRHRQTAAWPTSTARIWRSPSGTRPPRSLPPSPKRCAPGAPAPPAALRSPTTSRALPANATTAGPGGTNDRRTRRSPVGCQQALDTKTAPAGGQQ